MFFCYSMGVGRPPKVSESTHVSPYQNPTHFYELFIWLSGLATSQMVWCSRILAGEEEMGCTRAFTTPLTTHRTSFSKCAMMQPSQEESIFVFCMVEEKGKEKL